MTLPRYRIQVSQAGATNLTDLAKNLDVAPSTALRMVHRLAAAGLLTREVRPANRRETLRSLTVAGQRTVTARRGRDLHAAIAEIPAHQRADLARAMAAFPAADDQLWPSSSVE